MMNGRRRRKRAERVEAHRDLKMITELHNRRQVDEELEYKVTQRKPRK